MAKPKDSERAASEGSSRNPFAATLVAWLVPGAGHVLLGRVGRGVAFFAIVIIALVVGIELQGQLSDSLEGHPLEILRTLGCAGSGIPYFVARFGLGYTGHPEAAGFEYGGAFIVTAGLMNLMLILDVWDIARGLKE